MSAVYFWVRKADCRRVPTSEPGEWMVEAAAYEALDAMYRQQLDDRDKTIHNLRESAKIWEERHATVQGERERLFQVIELYRSASYQSHSGHFDPTGGSGSGCPACLRAIELRADARAILDSLAQPAAPSARGRMHSCDIPECVACGNPPYIEYEQEGRDE